MTEQKPFEVETIVNAPLDVVWRALTTPAQIREWFGWEHEGIDAEIQYIFVEHSTPIPPDRITLDNNQEITLSSDGRRTTVRVVMAGDLGDARWEDIYDGMEEGWRAFFEQLRFLLETQPRGGRRTLYLAGSTTGSRALAEIEADLKERWHDSRRQRIVVDHSGHLVGVAAERPLDATEPGPVGVTVTTYGLDDAAFAELKDRWAARWRSIAENPEITTR